MSVKLNVGCGVDYREGFINIDGSDTLPRIDKIVNISDESLLNHFDAGSIDYILANDIIEHHFHWEAVRILNDFYTLLRGGGTAEIRVPDAEFIINTPDFPIALKINLLYGGQDIPQGNTNMDESRKRFPQYFCHKYGWTMDSLSQELRNIGFRAINLARAESNFIAIASR